MKNIIVILLLSAVFFFFASGVQKVHQNRDLISEIVMGKEKSAEKYLTGYPAKNPKNPESRYGLVLTLKSSQLKD